MPAYNSPPLPAQDRAARIADALVQILFSAAFVPDLKAQWASLLRDEIDDAVRQAFADIPSIDS
jgi:hypothetical protein